MADDPRTYLLDRFASDATTLRARADILAGKPAPEHGPDSEASLAMAKACDEVIALLKNLDFESEDELLDALDKLGPELHSQAEDESNAFVRSVYAGAAARIEDIVHKTRDLNDDDTDDSDIEDDADEDDVDDDDPFDLREYDDELEGK